MAFTEQQLIQLRAQQLKHHEEFMLDVLIDGKEEYLNEYIATMAMGFYDQHGEPIRADLLMTIRDTANACIDHLFKTLVYD